MEQAKEITETLDKIQLLSSDDAEHSSDESELNLSDNVFETEPSVQRAPSQFMSQPPAIWDQIFLNLTWEDIMHSMLVSNAWYDHIATSKTCMKKIKVYFDNEEREKLKKLVQGVLESQMRFEVVFVAVCSHNSDVIADLFLKKSKQWKDVEITRSKFNDITQVFDCIEGLQETVEKLNMQNISLFVPFGDEKKRNFTFPNLKILIALNIQTSLFEAFENAKNIETLYIQCNTECPVALNAIIKMLKRCTKLKYLSMFGGVVDQVFYYEDVVKDFKFKLRKLSVNRKIVHSRIQTNFANFLKTQTESMESVTFHDWTGIDPLCAVFALPKLASINIYGFHHAERTIDWSKIKLSTNNCIKRFHFSSLSIVNESFKTMLGGLSKIESLYTTSIKQDSMESLSKALPMLRCFQVQNFLACDLSSKDLFPVLEVLSIISPKQPNIIIDQEGDQHPGNENIRTVVSLKEIILRKNEEDRSRMEVFYLDAMKDLLDSI